MYVSFPSVHWYKDPTDRSWRYGVGDEISPQEAEGKENQEQESLFGLEQDKADYLKTDLEGRTFRRVDISWEKSGEAVEDFRPTNF